MRMRNTSEFMGTLPNVDDLPVDAMEVAASYERLLTAIVKEDPSDYFEDIDLDYEDFSSEWKKYYAITEHVREVHHPVATIYEAAWFLGSVQGEHFDVVSRDDHGGVINYINDYFLIEAYLRNMLVTEGAAEVASALINSRNKGLSS